MEDLNDKNFEEFIKKHKIAIIDFYADWCGPCQMMKPVFHEIAEKFKLNIVVTNFPKKVSKIESFYELRDFFDSIKKD